MSKVFSKSISPDVITVDFICYEEDYKDWQIFKGFIHAAVIPFIIALIAPHYTFVYLVCAAFLYGTVFRYKSQGFFGTLALLIFIAAIVILPF